MRLTTKIFITVPAEIHINKDGFSVKINKLHFFFLNPQEEIVTCMHGMRGGKNHMQIEQHLVK